MNKILDFISTTVKNTYVGPQTMLLTFMFLAYLWIVIIDIKHREMWFLQEFGVGIFNAGLAIAFTIIWGSNKFILPLCISIAIWVIVVVINGMFNVEEEKKMPSIGSADIDLYSLQFCISIAIIYWIIKYIDPTIKIIAVMKALEMMFSSLVTGFVLTFFIWLIKIIFILLFKNKEKKKIKQVFIENKHVAAISAIVPLAFANMLLILSMQ